MNEVCEKRSISVPFLSLQGRGERDRQTYRQTDRQTDRDRQTETDRQRQTETERQR